MKEYYNTPIGELTPKDVLHHETEIILYTMFFIGVCIMVGIIIKCAIPDRQKTYEDILQERKRDKYENWLYNKK